MPEQLLPLFPAGSIPINGLVYCEECDGSIYYFVGCQPVFTHSKDDHDSFRMFTAQLVLNGSCSQMDIVRAFGVSVISVKRAVKQYREGGAGSFYQPKNTRGANVLTPEVLSKAQAMLDNGDSRNEVSKFLKIKKDTLYKAIVQGRLKEPQKKT